MSEVTYVKCDWCGYHDHDSREDFWHRNVSGWAEVHVRDDEEGDMKTMDFCPECWKKLMKAVE